jgi:hypothetical protein
MANLPENVELKNIRTTFDLLSGTISKRPFRIFEKKFLSSISIFFF